MEYEEERMFHRGREEKEDINSIENYVPNVGDFFKIPIVKETDFSRPISGADLEEFRKEAQSISELEENGSGKEDTDIS